MDSIVTLSKIAANKLFFRFNQELADVLGMTDAHFGNLDILAFLDSYLPDFQIPRFPDAPGGSAGALRCWMDS